MYEMFQLWKLKDMAIENLHAVLKIFAKASYVTLHF